MRNLVLKTIMVLLACTFSLVTVFAQSPEKMSYQAVIRNSSDQLVTNQSVGMQINILQGSASGTAVYVETHTPVTNVNGLVSIEIGDGTMVSGDFAAIDWTDGPFFIKIETDPAGGTDYTITGTSQLLSVPYALYAKTAETISGTIIETDPVYSTSVAAGITATDTTNWNDKLDSYTETQTLSDVISQNNSAGNANITDLADPVNPQDAVTKVYVDALLERIEDLEIVTYGFIDARDGNNYTVVKIGNQIWMAENLKYLPSVVGSSTGSSTTPYYYVQGYDGTNVNDAKATVNYNTYGVLYNWPAAMNGESGSNENPSGVQGVCPSGWHLPSDAERTELTDYLGGTAIAGGKLKETGTTHWSTPNAGATNETGFTALPGGRRHNNGTFGNLNLDGFWWNATENDTDNAWRWLIDYNFSSATGYFDLKEQGFSVRCVKD